MTPRCIILSGPSGAGKSTIAKQLTAGLPSQGYAICSADDYFMQGGVYRFNKSQLDDAHRECFLNFVTAVNLRVPLVIVDNTNIAGYEIAAYYRYAEAFGYDVSITKLIVRPEVAAARNVHGVPAKAVESMSKRHGGGWCPWWKVNEQNTNP
jgi:predicted ABC-type ATPase